MDINDLSHLSEAEFQALCPQGEHAPGPEPLSPAARAVLTAFNDEKGWLFPREIVGSKIAAALRAVANQLTPYSVGYIILPHRRYLRRSILSNLMQKLEKEEFMAEADVPASVNSYLGMLRHVNGYKARKKVCQRLRWLGYQSDQKLTKVFE